jgi:hypothetical protein
MNMRQLGRIATGGVISLSILRLKKIACDDGKTAPQQGIKTAPPQGITRGTVCCVCACVCVCTYVLCPLTRYM